MMLIEFLLARIDEEEDAVRNLFDRVRPGIGTLADPFHETRVNRLADLAARRKLIHAVIRDQLWDETAGFELFEHASGLAAMALSYSGHQDYHEEWRPE